VRRARARRVIRLLEGGGEEARAGHQRGRRRVIRLLEGGEFQGFAQSRSWRARVNPSVLTPEGCGYGKPLGGVGME